MPYYTPLDCEMLLTAQIQRRLSAQIGETLKSPEDNGAVPVAPMVVSGFVPSYQAGTVELEKAPVVAIRAIGGSFHRLEGETTIHFFVLTWDDDLSRQGYRDNLNILTAIYQELYEAGGVRAPDGRIAYVLMDTPVKWSQIEDVAKDPFPYFVGGLQAEFGTWTPGENPFPPFFRGPEAKDTLFYEGQGDVFAHVEDGQ